MVDVQRISHFPIKLVFIVHLVLITWGLQGYWAPSSYLFYNALFFLTLFWSIHAKESPEPLQIAVIINICSIAFDIIMLVTAFPHEGGTRTFSAAMAILNIVVRPFSSIILYKIMKERGGDMGDIGSFPGVGGILGNPRSYEDLDNPGPSHNLHDGPLDFNAPPSPPVKGPPPYH